MFILILTVFAVMLNDGSVIKLDPPKTAVIESYRTLKICEDARVYIADAMAHNARYGESTTYQFECKEARKIQ